VQREKELMRTLVRSKKNAKKDLEKAVIINSSLPHTLSLSLSLLFLLVSIELLK
jgi:hypothetical protein